MPASPLRSFWRTLAIVLFAAFALASSPFQAAALEDGEYIMQCSCPVQWSGDWDGNGVFNEDDTRDTIVLVNGDVTIILHEVPIDDATTESMIDDRQKSLENGATIEDLEVVWQDGDDEMMDAGRTWTNPDGDTVVSYQIAQVWEFNYMLSMEIIAPAEDLEDAWILREDLLLLGVPIFNDTEIDTLLADFDL